MNLLPFSILSNALNEILSHISLKIKIKILNFEFADSIQSFKAKAFLEDPYSP
jgi:hypothetical protein